MALLAKTPANAQRLMRAIETRMASKSEETVILKAECELCCCLRSKVTRMAALLHIEGGQASGLGIRDPGCFMVKMLVAAWVKQRRRLIGTMSAQKWHDMVRAIVGSCGSHQAARAIHG